MRARHLEFLRGVDGGRQAGFILSATNHGGVAQLARAREWHSRGRGFDSLRLHSDVSVTLYIIKVYANRTQVMWSRFPYDPASERGMYRAVVTIALPRRSA